MKIRLILKIIYIHGPIRNTHKISLYITQLKFSKCIWYDNYFKESLLNEKGPFPNGLTQLKDKNLSRNFWYWSLPFKKFVYRVTKVNHFLYYMLIIFSSIFFVGFINENFLSFVENFDRTPPKKKKIEKIFLSFSLII